MGSDLLIGPAVRFQSGDCVDECLLVAGQRTNIESERTAVNDEGQCWTSAGNERQRSVGGHSTVME